MQCQKTMSWTDQSQIALTTQQILNESGNRVGLVPKVVLDCDLGSESFFRSCSQNPRIKRKPTIWYPRAFGVLKRVIYKAVRCPVKTTLDI